MKLLFSKFITLGGTFNGGATLENIAVDDTKNIATMTFADGKRIKARAVVGLRCAAVHLTVVS